MPTSTVNLDYKAEQAVINWLGASATHGQTIGITPVHGDATDAYNTPALIVQAAVGDEHIHNSGWFRVQVDIALHTQADDDTASEAETYWQKVRAVMCWDELAARLSDLSDFHCWLAIREVGEGNDILDRRQIRTYRLNLICMASDNS